MTTVLSGRWHSAGRSPCRVLQTAGAAGPQRCVRHIHSVAARRPASETSGWDYAHPYLQRSVCRAAADPRNNYHSPEQGQQETQQEEGQPQQQQQRRRRRTKANTAAKEPRPLEKQQQEEGQAAIDTQQQQDEAQPQQPPRRRRQRRQSNAETAAKDPQAQDKQPQEEDQAAVGAAQQQQQQQVEEQQQPEAVSPGVSSDASPEAGPALSGAAPTGAPLPASATADADKLAATGQEQQDPPASSDSSASSSVSSDAESAYTWPYGYTTYEQVGYGTPTYGAATSAGAAYDPASYGGTPAAPLGYVPAYGAPADQAPGYAPPGSVPAYSPVGAVAPVYGPAASGPPAYGPPADQRPADGPPGAVPSVDWPTGYEAAAYGYPSYTYSSQSAPVAMAPPLMAVDFNADNRNTVGLSGCLAADPNLAINNGDNYKVEMIVLPFAFKSDGDNHIQAPNPVKVHVWGANGQAQAVWEQLRKNDPIAVLGTLRLDNRDNIRTKAGPAITVDAVVVARVKDSTIPRNAYCIPFSGVYPIGQRTFTRMGPSAGWRDTPSARSSSPYNPSSESSSAAGSPAYTPGGESSSAANKPAYVPADQYRVDDVKVAYETASAWCSGATLQQLAAERRCGLCQVAESVLQGQELVAGSGQPFDWHRLVRELGVNEQLLTAIKEGLVACREQVDRQGRVLRKAVRLYLRAHPVAGAMVRDQEAAWRNMDLTYRQISAVREGVLAGGL